MEDIARCARNNAHPMKIAVLVRAHTVSTVSAVPLEAAGIEAEYYDDFNRMSLALQQTEFQALLLEDDTERLAGWLSDLQDGEFTQIPRIVVGPADPIRMASALGNGAHDYPVAHSDTNSLICRLRARVHVHRKLMHASSLKIGPYELRAATRTLTTEGSQVSLTSREFTLAWRLFESVGRVVSLRELCAEICGRSSELGKRALEQHVYKLRRKIELHALGSDRLQIHTVYGVGYRLQL